MNGITVAYRSADAEVIQAWNDARDAINAYVKATEGVLDAAGFGQYQTWRSTSGWTVGKFRGLAVPGGEKPPVGWRMTNQYAVPDKRYKAGRDIAAALESVRHPGDPLFKLVGMPPDVLSGHGFSSPAVRLLEDGKALYVGWTVNPEGGQSFHNGRIEIDFTKWERVPLSAYYAATEQADTAKVGAL